MDDSYSRGKIKRFTKWIDEWKPEDGEDRLSDFYERRGYRHYILGEYGLSALDCFKAIELNPKNAEASWNCGRALTELGMYKRAIVILTMAIHIEDAADFREARAKACFGAGAYEQSIKDLVEADKSRNTWPEGMKIIHPDGTVQDSFESGK